MSINDRIADLENELCRMEEHNDGSVKWVNDYRDTIMLLDDLKAQGEDDQIPDDDKFDLNEMLDRDAENEDYYLDDVDETFYNPYLGTDDYIENFDDI